MTDFTASDVLLKAASRIEEEGMWCQGRWFDTRELGVEASSVGTGSPGWQARKLRERDLRVPECADGALISVHAELTGQVHGPALQKARRKLRATVNDSPILWNDQPDRTAAEVAEAMRQAAL